MKKVDNERVNLIMEYVTKNHNLLPEERRELVHYALKLNKENVMSEKEDSFENVFEDFKRLNEYMKSSNFTKLTERRFNDMRKILEYIKKYIREPDSEIVDEISRLLDKLYLEMDLPIRKSSSIENKIKRG